MFRNTVLVPQTNYHALGNKPAFCLTQHLPREQSADILCLGCGDARNVLFTCFADAARKIDVTCCDIEPGIHARNILLYSLLIDDRDGANINRIWNIYYHWKLDKESMQLLETQAQKLMQLSESTDKWYQSVYGFCIRFCDVRSLSLVRSYWNGFRMQGLTPQERERRLSQLQGAIDRAKDKHKNYLYMGDAVWRDLSSTSPIGLYVFEDMCEVILAWWENGTIVPAPEAVELNPAFLFSPNESLTLHCFLSPLAGFPLSTAYVPFIKESPFFFKHNYKSTTERLLNGAMIHFSQWASAFRKAVDRKSVIRIFCGDALALCCTLRNCQLTGATSANLFCDNLTNSPLKLDERHYGADLKAKRRAPLSFNVVDTSSLADSLGPLNVFATAASLLKYDTSSSLYVEMCVQGSEDLGDTLSGLFGVDARTISLLLGFVLPELYTNATDSVYDDMMLEKISAGIKEPQALGTQIRSRLRWKRLCGFKGLPRVHVEAFALAKLLLKIYDAIFGHEDPPWAMIGRKPNAEPRTVLQPNRIWQRASFSYNRASFALLLNLLTGTVVTNWEYCFEYIYGFCIKQESLANCPVKLNPTEEAVLNMCLFGVNSLPFYKANRAQELLLNMHFYGVDNGKFVKLPRDIQFEGALASLLPVNAGETKPDHVCVTIRVPREKLEVFTRLEPETMGPLALVCTVEDETPSETSPSHFFSSVQVAFGSWCASTGKDSYPRINEDNSKLSGKSDMFASFIVSTSMLLAFGNSVPVVKCGIALTEANIDRFMDELGEDLCFMRSKMTSEDVFITQFMPGMSALPTFARASTGGNVRELTLDTLSVRLVENGTKIDTVMRGMIPDCRRAKAKLAAKSSKVKIRFDSPMVATIKVEGAPKFKLRFPVPVSPSKSTFKIKRKLSYIEIESALFDPVTEKTASFMFPTIVAKTTPTAWTSTHVELDAMPRIDLNDPAVFDFFKLHLIWMFSNREAHACQANAVDPRTGLKRGLYRLFTLFIGKEDRKWDIFSLTKWKPDGMLQTLILPSCLRLDLVNRSVILDAAIIPIKELMSFNDPQLAASMRQLMSKSRVYTINKNEAENRAWKAMMPALVERCRTWQHVPGCQYVLTGEAPLAKALTKKQDRDVLPICNCGVGKFPPDYLEARTKKLSKLSYMTSHYATRVAISPIFALPYVEDCLLKEISIDDFGGIIGDELYWKNDAWQCANCEKEGDLLFCAACKMIKYCSKDCQRSDWKVHKKHCSDLRQAMMDCINSSDDTSGDES